MTGRSADERDEVGAKMQIPVEVTDEMRREAESRGLPLIDYVDYLVARGRRALQDESALNGAIERIRMLRSSTVQQGR